MSDYKRVTEKRETPLVMSMWGGTSQELKIYNRLAEIEDKIENGTLIELPCKVDGIVYFVSKKNGIQWSGITEIQVFIDRYSKFIKVRDDDNKWHSVNNKSVFLTKAEAEKKLEELREKK